MKIFKNCGFTLVELVVSMGLMSIFVLVSITSGKNVMERQKRENFLNSVDRILSTFRIARADAISNKLVGGVGPEGGYGAFLHKNSDLEMRIVRFVDDFDDSGAAAPTGNGKFDDGFDTVLEDFTLDTPWFWHFENTDPIGNPTDDFALIFSASDADLRLFDNTSASDIRKTEMVFQYGGVGATERRICLNRISRFFEVIGKDSSCF